MRLFRQSVLPGALAGMAVDAVLCFVAVLLAASTLTSRYMTIPRAVPEFPLILFGASQFALMMALMYALVGLYRPKPISVFAAAMRTAFALAIGGYLTSLTLRIVADRGYIEQLIPAAIAYLSVGLVVVRGCFQVMRRATGLPRIIEGAWRSRPAVVRRRGLLLCERLPADRKRGRSCPRSSIPLPCL